MEYDPVEEELDDHPFEDENVNDNDIIDSVESSHGWTAWRGQLAADMYDDWRCNRVP